MTKGSNKSKMQSSPRDFFGPKQPSEKLDNAEDVNRSGDRPDHGLLTTPSIATSSATSFASGVIKDVGTKPKVLRPQPPQRRNKHWTSDKPSSPNAEATTTALTADRRTVIPAVIARQMTASTPTGFGTAHTGESSRDKANKFQLGTKAGIISNARATGSTTKASLPAASATARLEESLPDSTSGIDRVFQKLLDTQDKLNQANQLVDQLLQENKKLQIAATEFCEYAQTEFTKNLDLQIATIEIYEAFKEFKANQKRQEQTNSEPECYLSTLQQTLWQICDSLWIPAMKRTAVELVIDFLRQMGTSMVRQVLKLPDTKNPTENTHRSAMSSSEFIDTLVSDKVRIDGNGHADSTKQDEGLPVSQSAPAPLSYQTIVCNVSGRLGRKGVKVIAALDSNVNQTLVDKDTAVELRSKRTSKTQAMKITMFDQQVDIDSYRVTLHLASIDGLQTVTITAYVVQDLATQLPVVDWSNEKKKFSHLQTVPFEQLPNDKSISLLIGSDYKSLLEISKTRVGTLGQPIACLTPLGWTCSVSPDRTEQLQEESFDKFLGQKGLQLLVDPFTKKTSESVVTLSDLTEAVKLTKRSSLGQTQGTSGSNLTPNLVVSELKQGGLVPTAKEPTSKHDNVPKLSRKQKVLANKAHKANEAAKTSTFK